MESYSFIGFRADGTSLVVELFDLLNDEAVEAKTAEFFTLHESSVMVEVFRADELVVKAHRSGFDPTFAS